MSFIGRQQRSQPDAYLRCQVARAQQVRQAQRLRKAVNCQGLLAALNGSLGWSNGPLLRNTNNALTVTATNTTYSGLTTATNGAVSGRTATWTTAQRSV